jgi:cob(I)alamin adenosyltransferase
MAIHIGRVYTRTGDKGETSLVGGKRVPKDSPRIRAFGTLDELNAIVGIARTFNEERLTVGEHHRWLDEVLRKIQNGVFDVGSELASPADSEARVRVGAAEVTALEALMDQCHARTVCRRAEREILALSRVEAVSEWPLRYVNRLSDLFFVLSRWISKHDGEREYLWERGLEAHRRKRDPGTTGPATSENAHVE